MHQAGHCHVEIEFHGVEISASETEKSRMGSHPVNTVDLDRIQRGFKTKIHW
jgi:hypothetical protein